jgi:hypothetical protein
MILFPFPKMEPKAMGAIDFCPLAKWVGEWCKSGLIAGRGSPGLHWREAEGRAGTPRDHKRGAARGETARPLHQGAGTGPGHWRSTRRNIRHIVDAAMYAR